MDCEGAAEHIWPSKRSAFWFLMHLGMLSMSAVCPMNHTGWRPSISQGNQTYLHCQTPVMKPVKKKKKKSEDEDDDENVPEGQLRKQPCNLKAIWRRKGTLQKRLPNTMSVTEYLKGIYWFLKPVPITTVLKQTGKER